MSERQERISSREFLLQLIDIEPQDVTLKFIFDNLRNYGIAASVMVAGFYLVNQDGPMNHFWGILMAVIGFLTYGLNLFQAIWVLVKLKIRFVPYFILSLLLCLGTSELLWVIISRIMHQK